MKIVGFELDRQLHLGVVDGDQVIDLQAVDPKIPADLGAVLARWGVDLSGISDAVKKAPASARRPLDGIKYTLPVANPGKIVCLGLNYLEHAKEGGLVAELPEKLMSCRFLPMSRWFIARGADGLEGACAAAVSPVQAAGVCPVS